MKKERDENRELVGLGDRLGDVGVSDLLRDGPGLGDGDLTVLRDGPGLGDGDRVPLPPGAMVMTLALGCGCPEFWS